MRKLLEKISNKFVIDDVLEEAIPLSLYRKYYKEILSKEGHKTLGDYRKRFDSWFPTSKTAEGKLKGSKWRTYIPLGGSVGLKVTKAPDDIKKELEKEGWSIEDYNKGMAFKKGGDKKDIKAEEWNSEKQYKALDFVKHDGKTYKAIKNPSIGVSPTDNKERQWLDFEKVAGGVDKKVEKSIGSILADLASTAKKSGNNEKERMYSNLERKNQTLQGRIQSRVKDTEEEKKTLNKRDIVVISRHPYDVMGASTDRGWSSCQNIGIGKGDYSTTKSRGDIKEYIEDKTYQAGQMVIFGNKIYTAQITTNKEPSDGSGGWRIDDTFKVTTSKDKETGKLRKIATRNFPMEGGMCKIGEKGEYYHGIGGDVRYGAMVAYLINSDDLNINNPKSRILIKPYVKLDGANKGNVYLFSSTSTYPGGSSSKEFKKTVDDWLDEHQTGEGVYHIKSQRVGRSDSSKLSSEYHYPEEPESMESKDYKGNVRNVKTFKDGLTWDEVISQHRWFAKSEFTGAVIGEEYGKLIVYEGNFTGGTWEDEAEGRDVMLNEVTIMKGSFKGSSINSCSIKIGDFDNCNIKESNWEIRGKTSNCKIDGLTISGSINAKNSDFKDTKFSDIPEGQKLLFSKCSFEQSKNLTGTFTDCIFKNDVTLSKDINIVNAIYDGINQNGGTFSGTLKSGNLKNVEIKKIIAKGGTLVNCDIKHGIIENAILKNCDFHAGIFGYKPGLGSKIVSKISPKSTRNRSKFFGGNFYGGTFAGGDFIKGTWHNEATWKGGYWHGGTNKPKNAKTKEDISTNKDIDIKSRLLAKTNKKEDEG